MARIRARVVDLRRYRPPLFEEPIELFARRALAAPKEDPLAVDSLLVSQRGVLVGSMHVDGDPERGEALDDPAPPRERALLHLHARSGVGVRCGLLCAVRVEVTEAEL